MPDGVIQIEDAKMPFMVLEVAVTETTEHMLQKADLYRRGSRGHIVFVVMIDVQYLRPSSKIRPTLEHWKVLLTIWKIFKRFSIQNSTRYRMVNEKIFKEQEVFPAPFAGSLKVSRGDILGKEGRNMAAAESGEIDLGFLHFAARRAVMHLAKQRVLE
jgi:hypothetical protein